MMKRWTAAVLMLCMSLACAYASSEGTNIILAAGENAPVLALQRSANFRADGERCGTSYRLFSDGSLEAYALYARQTTDEPILEYTAQIAQADYQAIEQLLNRAKVMDMPDVIENEIMDGDTVTLTLWTTEGEKSITSQSPDGLPFGDVVSSLEDMFRAHKGGESTSTAEAYWGDCMPPKPTYTPDMPEYHAKEGNAHYGHGDYEKAIASFETAISIDSRFMNGYYGLAMTYRSMGLLELSIDNYTAVIAVAPDYAQPYESRAQIYQFLGRYEEAEADLNQYVNVYGQYPVPYIARGDFYMERKEYQRAVDDYTTALQKGIASSALADVYLKRAEAWLKLGDIQKATADFHAAISHAE